MSELLGVLIELLHKSTLLVGANEMTAAASVIIK